MYIERSWCGDRRVCNIFSSFLLSIFCGRRGFLTKFMNFACTMKFDEILWNSTKLMNFANLMNFAVIYEASACGEFNLAGIMNNGINLKNVGNFLVGVFFLRDDHIRSFEENLMILWGVGESWWIVELVNSFGGGWGMWKVLFFWWAYIVLNK